MIVIWNLAYEVDSGGKARFTLVNYEKNVCIDKDVRAQLDLWINNEHWANVAVTGKVWWQAGFSSWYDFTLSGAGANMVHFYGVHYFSLRPAYADGWGQFTQEAYIVFPTRGNKTDDEIFLTDSLKLELGYRNDYAKKK